MTVLSLQSSFYTLLQNNPTASQITPFLSTPAFHHVPPPSSNVHPTSSTLEAVSHFTSIDPTLRIDVDDVSVLVETDEVVITTQKETVRGGQIKVDGKKKFARASVHDVWRYITMLTWVKEFDEETGSHQWLLRGALTSDAQRSPRDSSSPLRTGLDIRKPSHRSRVPKEEIQGGGIGGEDDLMGLMQALGGIRDSTSPNSSGTGGKGRIVVSMMKGGSLISPNSEDDVWDGTEGFDDPTDATGDEDADEEEEDLSRLVVKSLIEINSKGMISGAQKAAAIMEVVRNRAREKVHRCEICNGWEVVGGGGEEFADIVKLWWKTQKWKEQKNHDDNNPNNNPNV